ncbi:MAG: hypothetical protein KAW12_23540 [Candidatus Aminicenantes bacterium]|nr:hypothetical protein [Candidatus Aminicenantes bacterium]
MIKKISAVILILVIIFSPYLLIVDLKRYSPIVVMIWLLSIVYYIFVLRKKE